MAARRLIFVMIVLLLASSVAAALVPVPEPTADESTTSTPATPSPGALLEQTLRADTDPPREIPAEVDDELALTVVGSRPDLVEIMGLGQLEDLAPGSPARFNLLFAEPGTYTVRLIEADRPIGRIIVMPRTAGPEGEPDQPGAVAPA